MRVSRKAAFQLRLRAGLSAPNYGLGVKPNLIQCEVVYGRIENPGAYLY